ncbi:hypothetical protein [Helicobacter sp. 11S02596-1]|nr:hypothetical protein [Helicobacter sp. 11S02596-1]
MVTLGTQGGSPARSGLQVCPANRVENNETLETYLERTASGWV